MMYNEKYKLEMLQDAAFVQNKLLAKNGICKFGMLCDEDGEVLGYCYQKDGSFVFVDDIGEVVIDHYTIFLMMMLTGVLGLRLI